jgi:imidazolonepropionase-like amidohydrolase
MKTVASLLMMAVAGCALAQQQPTSSNRWVVTAKKIYVAPDEPAIQDGWVLVNGSTVETVSPASVSPPRDVRQLTACSGGVVTAGFQNSHVHFTDDAFSNAATRPREQLDQPLRRMLTGYGFTTVVDTGSDVTNTVALRQRIERGDIPGPAILTAGTPLYPTNGIPFYLRDMPPEILEMLHQPASADEAAAIVRQSFARGANGVKLFVASPVGGRQIKRMSPDITRAAVNEAHRLGGLAMAHPTDPEGVSAAVAAGVDIIVHTTIDPPRSAWSDSLVAGMVARKVSVIPTLKLWRYELDKSKAPANVREAAVGDAEKQLLAFAKGGGQVLFGTDVGYMTDHDPTDEYVLMARAGLTSTQILASLTTAAAARWNDESRRGRVKAGLAADLVVLNGDPASDIKNFASVKCTFRGGREIFSRP